MQPYSRYEDALIAKLKLLEFAESEMGARFHHGFQNSMNAMHQPNERLVDGMLHALQVRMLRGADPIYVSSDMTDLVDHARESFQPEILLPSDPWCPSGFAVFPRAVTLDDAPPTEKNPWRSPGGLIPVRAVGWHAIHTEDLSAGCFWISHYTNIEDDIEHGRPSAVESEEHTAFLRRHMPMSLVHTWQWAWGADPRETRAGLVEGEDEERSRKRANEQASFVQVLWRLGQQFVQIPHRVNRQLWRDAKRKGAAETKEVTVIVLRRAHATGDDAPETDEHGQHYKVSFLVRGYWAIRHFRDGPRQVWVRPHVKGQGPFQQTDRAWELKR